MSQGNGLSPIESGTYKIPDLYQDRRYEDDQSDGNGNPDMEEELRP